MAARAYDLALYDRVQGSNLPANAKSEMRKWFEKATGTSLSIPSFGKLGHHVKRGVSAMRTSGEAGMTGALLGLIHAEAKTGLDVHGVPMDALLWGITTFGGIAAGDHELGTDAINIGANCLSVFSFRMVTNFLVRRQVAKGKPVPAHLIPGSTIQGQSTVHGEDPILKAARDIHL